MENVIPIDDQPISAGFFGEGRWLTSYITPDAQEVQALHKELTEGIADARGRIVACWQWVASQVKYVKLVKSRTWISGKSVVQRDLWTPPEITIKTRIGNCAVKSLLLSSLLRNELPAAQVHCVLGNLYNGKPGGHSWVNLTLGDEDYYMESTMLTAPPLIASRLAERYEAVHYFNDREVLAVPGKTVLVPYTRCYSDWLEDYLNWAYIEGRR